MLLNYDYNYIDQVLSSTALFAPDMSPANDPTFVANNGIDYHQRRAQKSLVIDLMAKPFIPPFEMLKLIPSKMRWEFHYTFNSNAFCLKQVTTGEMKLRLLKAELLVCH